MLISRLKTMSTLLKPPKINIDIKCRMSGGKFYYRTSNREDHSKTIHVCSDLLGGFFIWWVLWHCWHDYGHIIGEFPYPDVKKWGNRELGIPSPPKPPAC